MLPDPTRQILVTAPAQDLLLGTLVAMAEEGGIDGLGLTVNVSGAVITGELVGRRTWFASLQESVDPVTKLLVGSLADRLEAAVADQPVGPVNLVHLRDARYVTGGTLVPSTDQPASHWRCRIAEVTAWSIGDLHE